MGNTRLFYLTSSKTGTTYTWIGGEQSNNLSRSADAVEVSDKQTEWRTFISGRKSATASVTCTLDDSSTAEQRKLLKALRDGDTVFCFVGTVKSASGSSTPSTGTAFEAIITSCDDDNPQDGVSTRTFNLQATGALTEYPTLA